MNFNESLERCRFPIEERGAIGEDHVFCDIRGFSELREVRFASSS